MDKIQNENKQCEICKEQGTCICYKCFSYFCDSCFRFVHEKKVNNEHKKEKIDYFVSIDTKCPLHPTNPINLFCIDEKGKQKKQIYYLIVLCCALCHLKNIQYEINYWKLMMKNH